MASGKDCKSTGILFCSLTCVGFFFYDFSLPLLFTSLTACKAALFSIPRLNLPFSFKPIQPYHIACSLHSSVIITRIELLVAECSSVSGLAGWRETYLFMPALIPLIPLFNEIVGLFQPVIKCLFKLRGPMQYIACISKHLSNDNYSIWPIYKFAMYCKCIKSVVILKRCW